MKGKTLCWIISLWLFQDIFGSFDISNDIPRRWLAVIRLSGVILQQKSKYDLIQIIINYENVFGETWIHISASVFTWADYLLFLPVKESHDLNYRGNYKAHVWHKSVGDTNWFTCHS